MDIAIMVEAQNGLTWPRWQNLVAAVEDLGFAGLYRSDHFTNANPPDMESLELWVSLTWLASHTKRIEFGPMVSPVSFRHPALTARIVVGLDDLSGGRLTLGLGAGWQECEYNLFGFELLDLKPRFTRFEEGLEVITRLFRSDSQVAFDGNDYNLSEASSSRALSALVVRTSWSAATAKIGPCYLWRNMRTNGRQLFPRLRNLPA